MADELEKDNQTEEITETPQEEEHTAAGSSGPSNSVLDKIQGLLSKKADEDSNPEPEETQEDSDDDSELESEEELEDTSSSQEPEGEDGEGDEIPDEFTEVARKLGWDDDKIIDFAGKYTNQELYVQADLMTRHLGKSKTPETTVTPQKTEDNADDTGTLIDEDLADELEGADEASAKVIKALARKLNRVTSELEGIKKDTGALKQSDAQREIFQNYQMFESMMDEASDDYPMLGNSEELSELARTNKEAANSSPEFILRSELFDVAQMFNRNGMNFRDAVKNAFQWYKGQIGEKEVRRKVLKEINDKSKKTFPKRQSVHVTKEYDNEDDRKASVINDALRKHGKEIPFNY